MIIAKRVAALAAFSLLIALPVPGAGQSGPGGAGSDMRLHAWERQLVLPQKISARLTWAERRLQPSGLRKLKTMARELAPAMASGDAFGSLKKQADAKVIATYPGLAADEVSEAAFIVLTMAAKDMDNDIRLIIAEIKATNAAKKKMRGMIKDLDGWISERLSSQPGAAGIDDKKAAGSRTKALPLRRTTLETRTSPKIHLEYVKAPVVTPLPPRNPGLTVSAVKSLQADIQAGLDGLNELSEETALRLQLTMEHRAKIIQTISNIMKKIGTTQERVVQNIK